jgi:hypothetical protein
MNSQEYRRSQNESFVELLSRLPNGLLERMKKLPAEIRNAALALRNSTPIAERRDFTEVRSGFYTYSEQRTSQSKVQSTEQHVVASEYERLAAQRRTQAALIAALR